MTCLSHAIGGEHLPSPTVRGQPLSSAVTHAPQLFTIVEHACRPGNGRGCRFGDDYVEEAEHPEEYEPRVVVNQERKNKAMAQRRMPESW